MSDPRTSIRSRTLAERRQFAMPAPRLLYGAFGLAFSFTLAVVFGVV